MSKSNNKNFTPENYCLVFDEVLACQPTRSLFREFLCKAKADEPLLFLDIVEEYNTEYESVTLEINQLIEGYLVRRKRSSIVENLFSESSSSSLEIKSLVNLYSKLKKIMDEFIDAGATKELNLSSVRNYTMDEWKKIQLQFKEFEEKPSIEFAQEILQSLNSEKLFEKVKIVVNLDLKMDQFPRFIRSDMVRKFLLEKGENFTRTVAIDISKGFKVDLRFKPKDLKSKEMTDNFIYFGLTLVEDTPDWELIMDKNDLYQAYISKTPYVFNQDTMIGMQLAKAVINLPYNIDDVFACYWNSEIIEKHDPMVFKGRRGNKYFPPTMDQSNDYGLAVTVSSVDIFPLKRTLCFSTTIVRDSEIDAIMIVAHSAEMFQNDFPELEIEHKMLQGFFYWFFYRVGDNLTRLVISTYTEVNIQIFPSLIYKLVARKRTKMIRNALVKELDKLTEGGTKRMDTSSFGDELNFKKSLEDNTKRYPNRSWYKEWLDF